jgi:ATP-dependent Clp protease ATP-binding subunit ClpC
MNYNFTDRVRKVLAMAREDAAKLSHDYVAAEHFLLGMLRENEGVGVTILQHLDIDLRDLADRLRAALKPGTATIGKVGEIPYTSRTKKVLEYAMAEARELGHAHVGTEHILLGLVREEKSLAGQILRSMGVTLERAREQAVRILGGNGPAAAMAGGGPEKAAVGPATGPARSGGKSKTPALDHFTRDLTELARSGRIDPVVGREREIKRVGENLSRKK